MQGLPENRIPEDEIDLHAIKNRLANAFAYPFRLFSNNMLITFLFILLAVGCSITLKYVLPKSYKSSCIIRPNDKNEKFHLRMLGDIQVLLKHKDWEGISRELKLPENVARQIVQIETNNPFFKNRSDSINYTEITIHASTPSAILPIQNSLLEYLENSPYFKKITDLHRVQLKMNMTQVDSDLSRLDSLKKLQLANYGNKAQGNQLVFMNDLINPTATYTMAAERLVKKNFLLAQQVFFDHFQLIKSAIIVKQHSWPPRILEMCLVLIPFFLLICFIFLHSKERAKRTHTT